MASRFVVFYHDWPEEEDLGFCANCCTLQQTPFLSNGHSAKRNKKGPLMFPNDKQQVIIRFSPSDSPGTWRDPIKTHRHRRRSYPPTES